LQHLGALDTIVFAAYLILVFCLALLSMRGQCDNEDYFLAGLFAAAMSTVDSGINGVASVIAYDWLDGRQLPLSVSRALTLVLGLLVTAAALAVPWLGDNVIDIINTIAGTLLGGLLAIFLLGMFSKRTNTPGVLIGLTSGAVSMAVIIASTDVPRWWYGAFAIFPTLLVGITVSRWFQPPSSQALADTMLVLSRRKERL
jgi:Na+/proline symporter